MGVIAYVGLGANLGDPVEQIVNARKRISEFEGTNYTRSSSLYHSSPVGYSDQPMFTNCVVELSFNLDCRDLFMQMQNLETCLGRKRDPDNQNGPRFIDIDLLLFGDSVVEDEDLVVPHPRMHERLFVLLPLQELNAKLAKTVSNNRLAEPERYFPGQSLVKLAI